MVGRDHRDVAKRHLTPQLFDLGAGADRWVDLGLSAQTGNVVFLVQDQIVDAALDGRREALVAIAARDLVSAPKRAVDDMRRAGRGCRPPATQNSGRI